MRKRARYRITPQGEGFALKFISGCGATQIVATHHDRDILVTALNETLIRVRSESHSPDVRVRVRPRLTRLKSGNWTFRNRFGQMSGSWPSREEAIAGFNATIS